MVTTQNRPISDVGLSFILPMFSPLTGIHDSEIIVQCHGRRVTSDPAKLPGLINESEPDVERG
jgi:hypothetical protein